MFSKNGAARQFEIFECLRSHTIGEAYADKMLLLLLMLVSQYETHIFLDHDLAKEAYPDLLDLAASG
ncbi:hypothetical protein ME798_13760 [Lactobacillus delbrueckii]|nr:hypothetical protein ME795_11840 [Lactobacillus delbrueckii]GHN45846.1 hypothetical protein ME798_13760 [Lactobacillus delbrueckii]